jgi:Bacterial Ig domain
MTINSYFWAMNHRYSFLLLLFLLPVLAVAQTPGVGIISPTNSPTFAEGTDFTVSVTATAPASATNIRVQLLQNGTAISSQSATAPLTPSMPFSFTIKDGLPGSFSLTARLISSPVASSSTSGTITSAVVGYVMTFADGTIKPYIHWNFDNGLEYWKLVGDWRPEGAIGWHDTPSLWGFTLAEGNFASSPGMQLTAGQSYTLTMLDETKSNSIPIRVYLTPNQSLADTAQVLTTFRAQGPDDFTVVRGATFTAPRTGVFHITFRHDWRSGSYQKMYFDNIRVVGPGLNIAPLCKITFPTNATITIPTGATVSLQASASDPDGSIARVDYVANGQIVGTSTKPPSYTFDWAVLTDGTYDLVARATDNGGAAVGYVPMKTIVISNSFTSATYLGGTGDTDEVRGSVIQQNGAIVLAANVSDRAFPGVPVRLLNGAAATSPGCIIKLTADGKTILAVTRVSAFVSDLATDASDNLYVAASSGGYLKLNPSADTLVWKFTPPAGQNVFRVDAGPSGINAIVTSTNALTAVDSQLSGTNIRSFDAAGNLLNDFGDISQYTSDVAVHETSQTIIGIGFRNTKAQTSLDPAAPNPQPIYIPVIRGWNYNGSVTKYSAYNWDANARITNPDGTTALNPRWVNVPENNMADVRAFRCSIGRDDKLYVCYEVAGGNHVLRYNPFSVTTVAPVVGGDTWFNFANSNTEIKVVVGRYDPPTGNVLLSQQFTARLPSTKANTVFTKYGAVEADEDGRVYVTGASAFGLPLTIDHQPGDYTGGAFLLILSPDMTRREVVLRLITDGQGHTIAIKNRDYFVWGGKTKGTAPLYAVNPLQPARTSPVDGWFAVMSRTTLTRCTDASVRQSLQSGDWRNPITWGCGLIPSVLERTIVQPGHIVTLDKPGEAANLTEQPGGTLRFKNGGRLRLGQ